MLLELNELNLSTLRQANTLRIPQYKNANGKKTHTKDDGSDWSLADWLGATIGEFGEMCNLLKKVRRGDFELTEAREELAKELADIVCYLDILAMQVNIPLRVLPTNALNPLTSNEAIIELTVSFGRVAEHLKAIELEQPVTSLLSVELEHVMNTLQSLCLDLDINLGQSVINKFNEVSKRVGNSVFLKNNKIVVL